jgi:hypothetical protein
MKLGKIYAVLSLLVVFSMLLAACQPSGSDTTGMPETEAPSMTEAPAATEAPAQTSRHGGWLDEIDVSVVSGDSAISQLQAGAIDYFSFGLASDVYPAIKEAGLKTTQSFGSYYGISFNPSWWNIPI